MRGSSSSLLCFSPPAALGVASQVTTSFKSAEPETSQLGAPAGSLLLGEKVAGGTASRGSEAEGDSSKGGHALASEEAGKVVAEASKGVGWGDTVCNPPVEWTLFWGPLLVQNLPLWPWGMAPRWVGVVPFLLSFFLSSQTPRQRCTGSRHPCGSAQMQQWVWDGMHVSPLHMPQSSECVGSGIYFCYRVYPWVV